MSRLLCKSETAGKKRDRGTGCHTHNVPAELSLTQKQLYDDVHDTVSLAPHCHKPATGHKLNNVCEGSTGPFSA